VFSNRLPSDLGANRLARAIAEVHAAGRSYIDLTESNPTRADFDYPAGILAPMGDARALTYRPAPLGLDETRRAIAGDYQRQGLDIPADRLVVTASTSEAYSLLFKLLIDANGEVLVPRPSYPLFDHLTRLDVVGMRPYDLEYHERWTIDVDGLERAITPKTKIVLLVSPNNPTGSFVTPSELERIDAVCAARDIAVVVDAVFAEYVFSVEKAHRARGLVRSRSLSFTLGGLSKSVGLPQIKLGWIAVSGPDTTVAEALRRLELICDTYLSVSTPAQLAAGDLLEQGAIVREQILTRVRTNYRRLAEAAGAVPSCRVLNSDAGWYGVLQVPTFEPEEDLVVHLLEQQGVLVHPGYFFDFDRESFLILSLLPPPHIFQEGLTRVLRHFACTEPSRTA
jgi:alanine-synthesizing transaminase